MMAKYHHRLSLGRMHESRKQKTKGIIIPTVIFVILLCIAAGSILELTLNSYKLSKRNEIRARARSLAESEMEIFFYKFKNYLMTGQALYASELPALFAASDSSLPCDTTELPTTARTPFAKLYRDDDLRDPNNLEKDDWIVRRSVVASLINPTAAPGPEQYIIQGTPPNTTKTGKFSYLVARIVVEPGPSHPLYGQVKVRIGRRVNYATASVFQYNVFSEGDLEFAPGGNTRIEGDVAANGSIYMGASSGGTLTINGYIRYVAGNYFNQAVDSSNNLVSIYRKPGTLMPNGVNIVSADATDTSLAAPIFGTSATAQVSPMNSPENLLGGVDAAAIAKTNPELFGPNGNTNYDTWTDAQKAEANNNIYRSLIAPPPDVVAAALASSSDVYSSEYPSSTTISTSQADNASISALRAYNRAGLIVTVGPDGTITSITGKTTRGSTVAITDLTSTLKGSVVTTTKTTTVGGESVTTPLSLYDQREGKTVAITEVDVGALASALAGSVATADSSYDFNGLVYIYLANSSSTTPAAVRLVNGANTPGAATSSGFSVATNGGLYVKGDYNTTTSNGTSAITNDYTGKINPTMLMADSVTVLSSAWADANSTLDGSPIPTLDAEGNPVVDGEGNPVLTPTSSDIANRVAVGTQVGAVNVTTINAGILTGNVSAKVSGDDTSPTASGGGQNLVRFMEDWSGKNVTFRGSLGRLFDSRHFTATFEQPGKIYKVPGLRTFSFNQGLKTDTVPGQPLITYFSRGDFFTW